jgi:hypothetical protein
MSRNQKIMILISKTFPKSISIFFFFLVIFPVSALAQENSLTLSVSPTLFDMTASPGQEWVSTIRVINANPFDLHVYANVVNFANQGEVGKGKLIPVLENVTGGQTLAEWIHTEKTDIHIPAEQTVEIPFSITVPDNAAPGGHFAAILIGTKPPDDGENKMAVETSQVVTSLVFLRVTGDILEKGEIREFRSTQYIAERPQMSFDLRFQNKGNVHILPQGEIKILNMWGEERGIIPVNKQTLFGNVLPNSIRKYSFTWTGKWSIADIGRYTAIATLAYGDEQRQFASSETSFWIIPWKITLGIVVFLAGFILLVTWSIKLYIRKMLSMAGVTTRNTAQSLPLPRGRKRTVSVVAPLEEGMLDLRERITTSSTWKDTFAQVIGFVTAYRLFFIVTTSTFIFIALIFWYITAASTDERPYEVTINNLDGAITVSSEQVQYEALKEESTAVGGEGTKQDFPPIKIVNQSGISGLAATLRLELEQKGYEITELTHELESAEVNTVIVYAPEYAKEALELSGQVYGALLSAYAEASGSETPIVIYVGQDLENAVQ